LGVVDDLVLRNHDRLGLLHGHLVGDRSVLGHWDPCGVRNLNRLGSVFHDGGRAGPRHLGSHVNVDRLRDFLPDRDHLRGPFLHRDLEVPGLRSCLGHSLAALVRNLTGFRLRAHVVDLLGDVFSHLSWYLHGVLLVNVPGAGNANFTGGLHNGDAVVAVVAS